MDKNPHSEIPPERSQSSVALGVILLLLSVPFPLLTCVFLVKIYAGAVFWADYWWFWNTETEMQKLLLHGVSAFLAFLSWRALRKQRIGAISALAWFFLVLGLFLLMSAVRGPASVSLRVMLVLAVLCCLPRELWKRWRLYVAAAGVLLMGIVAVCFCPSIPRLSRYVSTPHSDIRSLATAVEAYAVDNHGAYPAWTAKPEEQAFFRGRQRMPSFKRYSPGGTAMLTTPVAFITDFPRDYFSYLDEDRTYAYWAPEGTTDRGWIIWSPGPDGVFDINLETLPKVYDPDRSNPSPELLLYSYDPTNGRGSAGDIWRVKQ